MYFVIFYDHYASHEPLNIYSYSIPPLLLFITSFHFRFLCMVKDGSSNERERKGSLREREEERMVKWRGKVARVTCQFKVHLEGQEGEAVSRLYVMHSPHEIPLHSQASCIVCKITKPSPKFTLHIFSLSLSLSSLVACFFLKHANNELEVLDFGL